MVKVLWVSRHEPLKRQIEELRKHFGEIEIEIIREYVPNAEYVVKKAEEAGAKVIVPVLPMSFVARLVEMAREKRMVVLWAEMQLIHRCKTTSCPSFREETDVRLTSIEDGEPVIRHFRFSGFKEVLGLDFLTVELGTHKYMAIVKILLPARDSTQLDLIATDIVNAIQEVLKQHGIEGEVRFA